MHWSCLVSGLYPMNFPISWLTDQWVSFVGPMRDVYYTWCYYYYYFEDEEDRYLVCSNSKSIFYGLIIALLPLLLRMIQCLRQAYDKGRLWRTDEFYNFFKYAASLLTAVISYGTKFHKDLTYIWIASAAISMSYSYYWDLTKDWYFFQPTTKYSKLFDSNNRIPA